MRATHLDLQRELFHGKAEDKNSEPVTIALTVVVDSENDKLMAFSIQATLYVPCRRIRDVHVFVVKEDFAYVMRGGSRAYFHLA